MKKPYAAALLAALIVAAPATAAAQQFYKWVDDQGVTHYGEKPPPGRPAKEIDATPSGYTRVPGDGAECHTIQCQYDRLRAARRQDEADRRATDQAEARQARSDARNRGMSFDTFRSLSTGMPEGEVLLRAGPPDYKSNQFLSSGYIGKTWYYYPTRSDPFTTVIQISGGQVFSLDRVRQF
jgi:hypothetical protein